MKAKLRLLPHWCQIVGYSYVLAFMLWICFGARDGYNSGDGIDQRNRLILRVVLNHRSIVGGINFVMIFLAIFSKEKVEDEMTTSIRVNALLVSATPFYTRSCYG